MKNKKILIVEDEVLVALRLKLELEKSDYSIIDFVISGEEAIRKAESLKPDVILMDIRLAGKIDGIEAALKITSFSSVPIIFMTGYDDKETLCKVKKINPEFILIKPVNILDLKSALSTIF